MATTALGAELTEAHRQAQLVVRAGVLNQAAGAWQEDWDDEDIKGSWGRLESKLVDMTQQGYARSAEVAANYYGAFRQAEGVIGAFSPVAAETRSSGEIAGWLQMAGPEAAGIMAGRGQPQLGDETFSNVAGSMGRNVLDGGRDTLQENMLNDPKVGKNGKGMRYARVTSGNACEWCEKLASQGFYYHSKESAGEGDQWHPHCACEPEPEFEEQEAIDQINELRDELEGLNSLGAGYYDKLREIGNLMDAEVLRRAGLEFGPRGGLTAGDRRAYNREALALLKEIRPFGGKFSAFVGDKAMIDRVQKSAQYYPSDWIQRSNARGSINVQRSEDGRGYYQSMGNKVALSGRGPNVETHELFHRMEHVKPEIKAAEARFWQERAGDEQVQRLKDIYPYSNYGTNEWAIQDQFADAYQGKVYGAGTTSSSWEIGSMAMEAIAHNATGPRLDQDYYRFMLGLLAGA